VWSVKQAKVTASPRIEVTTMPNCRSCTTAYDDDGEVAVAAARRCPLALARLLALRFYS
jgi:hypothetical protein